MMEGCLPDLKKKKNPVLKWFAVDLEWWNEILKICFAFKNLTIYISFHKLSAWSPNFCCFRVTGAL